MKKGAQQNTLPAGLASPARRALAAAGFTRLDQFTTISEAELLKLHGLGPKAVDAIKRALHESNLAFAKEEKSANISVTVNQRIERRKSR